MQSLIRCRDVALLRLIKGFRQRIVQFGRCLIDISENECRDVALLRLIKGFRQRIINLWRCLMGLGLELQT
jgi:hypothetical protein